MKLFSGLDRTDYQDVLRAVGLFLDEHGYRSIRLMEHEDGIIVQVIPTVNGRAAHHYETFLLREEDIQQLMHDAYRRRGAGPRGGTVTSRPIRRPLLRGQGTTPPL